MPEEKVIPVRVAVRCRPLIDKEIREGCCKCLRFDSESPQVIVGKDKAFTYDFAFDTESTQVDVYSQCVKKLVSNVFKGQNATVFAYGQTGSGKTHTMGGCYEESLRQDEEKMGIIPRTLSGIFGQTANDKGHITLKISYLEIHKEDIVDLLCPVDKREALPVREDPQGTIQIPGLQEVEVADMKTAMDLLQRGSQGRSTGATAMNATSSRSHAIFTVHIERLPTAESDDSWRAKFHLVDLAGSERVKKTHAEGDRLREGININKGLLCLGNVINALGDDTQRKGHVPYRDSKLTRILQDSLGGNSHTLMIACISPADSNLEETLNTLRYADRARKIKNKPIVNRDPNAAEMQRLRELVQTLQLKLEENLKLTQELQNSVEQNTQMCERNIKLEFMAEQLRAKMDAIKQNTRPDLELLSSSLDAGSDQDVARQLIQTITDKICNVKDEETQVYVTTTDTDTETTNDESDASGIAATPITKAEATQYALRQAHMQRELAELNALLSKKQDLAAQMSHNDSTMVTLKLEYENTMKDLESQVNSLTKEKDGLTQALRDAYANTATSQVSEQRRRRLQELESELGRLKKKMMEQSKVLKIKSQTDQQVINLNRDIQNMKQHRVKLMKQMKEEADNYRKWKRVKDKEVMQLVQKDRKREFEMAKLQRANEKQKSVLKRKVDEAAAANRRLKDAMAKQKVVSDEREKKLEKYDSTAIGLRVREWCSNEMDIRVGVREAKYHLASMLNDRKDLTQQLQDLKERIDNGPPSAKYMAGVSENLNWSIEEEEMRERVTELQQDIDLRNSQISDLQQKVIDAEQDGKGNALWDTSVHTMVEAKCALKWLMEQAVTYKADLSLSKGELSESRAVLQESRDHCDVIKDTCRKGEEKLKEMKRDHERDTMRLRKEHEEKVLFLLRMKNEQIDPATSDQSLREKLAFQQSEIERLSLQQESIEQKDEEIDNLKKQLQRAMLGPKKLSLMPELTPGGSRQRPLSYLRERKDTAKPKHLSFGLNSSETSGDDQSESDDESRDADWQRTPMVTRAVKRPSIAPKICKCYGSCLTKICGCQKMERKCGDECRCNESMCVNRDQPLPESTTDDLSLNLTFTTSDGTTLEAKRANKDMKKVRKTFSQTKMVTAQKINNDENEENQNEDDNACSGHAMKVFRKSKEGKAKDLLVMKPVDNTSTDDDPVLLGGIKKKRKLLTKTSSGMFFSKPA